MKRLISTMMVLCLLLGMCGVAFAARPSITEQPVSQTVEKGGTVTLTVKADNARGVAITWHFQDPLTGKDITGKQLSKHVSGLKVTNPNSLSITLRKVPESMHGWTAYCHIGPKNSGIDTDTVMILIKGMEAPETPVPASASDGEGSQAEGSSEGKSGSKAGSSGKEEESLAETVTAEPTPAAPTATPKPENIVITGNSRIELYKIDNQGVPLGKAAEELTFTGGEAASFYVKIPDGTEGTIQYVSVDGIRFTPDGEVRGMSVRGWPASAAVRIKVLKPGSSAEDQDEGPILPEITEVPEDPSAQMAVITCENCRFTGYKSSYAKSGEVPVGTTITVIASGGMVGKGYIINGAKKATHKNEATFQYVVEGDTTITMEKQK